MIDDVVQLSRDAGLERLYIIEGLLLFAMANLSGVAHSGDADRDWDNCNWWCRWCQEYTTGDPFELKHTADCPYGYADAHYMDICRTRREEGQDE